MAIVFPNRAGGEGSYEEGLVRQCESLGVRQARDEAGVNRGSGSGVVRANLVVVLADIELCRGACWHGP